MSSSAIQYYPSSPSINLPHILNQSASQAHGAPENHAFVANARMKAPESVASRASSSSLTKKLEDFAKTVTPKATDSQGETSARASSSSSPTNANRATPPRPNRAENHQALHPENEAQAGRANTDNHAAQVPAQTRNAATQTEARGIGRHGQIAMSTVLVPVNQFGVGNSVVINNTVHMFSPHTTTQYPVVLHSGRRSNQAEASSVANRPQASAARATNAEARSVGPHASVAHRADVEHSVRQGNPVANRQGEGIPAQAPAHRDALLGWNSGLGDLSAAALRNVVDGAARMATPLRTFANNVSGREAMLMAGTAAFTLAGHYLTTKSKSEI